MQMSLMHETLNDALREVVQAAGGAKKVGCAMFPEKLADEAASRVRDCLNSDRREVFSPEQVLWLLRLGRQVDCHGAMAYLNREAGYSDPQTVEPEDEVRRLQREFVDASKALMGMAAKIEVLQQSGFRRVA